MGLAIKAWIYDVSDVGYRVWDMEVRFTPGSGIRVSGSGYRVVGYGFRVL